MSETNEPMVREDGTYPTESLRRDMIVATVVQTRVNGVDGANPAPGIRRNLDYFKESIDIAQVGLPSDLLLFHEFPITGFTEWTREQHYNLAIEVPGPGGRGNRPESKAIQLLYRFRHLCQGPGELARPYTAPDGHGGARRQRRRQALETAQRPRHVPRLRAVHLFYLRCL